MKLKDAFSKLKSQTGKPLKYFYCEKGADGNPVVLMGPAMPTNDEQSEVLKKAQSKKVSRGSMTIDETGTLCIAPKGSAPSGLERGVEKAAKLASAKVFNSVIIVDGKDEEEEQAEESQAPAANATAPAAKPAPGSAPPVIAAHRAAAPGSQPTAKIVKNEGYGNPQAVPAAQPAAKGAQPAAKIVKNEGYGNPQAVPASPAPVQANAPFARSGPSANASGPKPGKPEIASHRANPQRGGAPSAPAANSGNDAVEYSNDPGAVEYSNNPNARAPASEPGAVEYANDPNAARPASSPGAVEYSNNAGAAAAASNPGEVDYSNDPNATASANESGYDSSIPPGYEGGAPAASSAPSAANANAAAAAKTPKVWSDPLARNSRMAEFIKLKKQKEAELTARLAEVTANGAAPSPEQQEELDKMQALVDKIQAAMSQEILKQAKTGATPKALEAEYVGEDQKKGWLALPRLPGETDEQVAKRLKLTPDQVKKLQAQAETSTSVRRNLTDKEKEDNTIRIDEDGYARDTHGDLDSQYGSRKNEFVADAESGDITKFTASATPTGQKVLDQDGKLVDQTGRVHHSSVLAGEDALMAGSITTEKGEITGVSNVSGHYKPQIADMLQFLEKLMSQGALLDKEWLNADGTPLTGQAKDVYEAAVALQKKLPAKAKEEQNEQVKADLEVIKKAKAMLQKLGCAPSNKINLNAQVEFLGGTADMTGLQIKQNKNQAQNIAVKDFVQGGNNQKQVANKSAVLQEMKGSSEEAIKKLAGQIEILESKLAEIPAEDRAEREKFEKGIDVLKAKMAKLDGPTKFQQANEQAERTATKPIDRGVAEQLKAKLSEQIDSLEDRLAELPEERVAERTDLDIRLAGLKRKLDNLDAPTNEDLKGILNSLNEIKARVLPAARVAPSAPPPLVAASRQQAENVYQ